MKPGDRVKIVCRENVLRSVLQARLRTRENLEAFYGQLARMYDRFVDNGNTWQPRTGGLSLAEKMVELAAAAIEQRAPDRVCG